MTPAPQPIILQQKDNISLCLCLLSVFVTTLGLLIYVLKRKTHPRAAKVYLKCAIASSVIQTILFLVIVFYIYRNVTGFFESLNHKCLIPGMVIPTDDLMGQEIACSNHCGKIRIFLTKSDSYGIITSNG